MNKRKKMVYISFAIILLLAFLDQMNGTNFAVFGLIGWLFGREMAKQ